MINRTGAFSLAVNGNKRWFPEIADIPVLQKRIAVRIVFSQNRNIPIYRLYRPPLTNMSQAAICNSITISKHNNVMSVTTRVSLSDCFEQVASVKTL